MPTITRLRQGELLRGVFSILIGHPDGLPAKAVLEKMPKVVVPTEGEMQGYARHPEVPRYEKIIRFSTIGPVKAGWLVKDKGQWILTEEGKKAFHRFQDPEELFRESSRLHRRWKADRPAEEEPEEEEPEDTLRTTSVEEAEEAAWNGIEEHLMEMNPYDFQQAIAGLLRGMGYHVAWISPPGPDKGIDVLAHTDPLGITGPRIKVQVKRRADRATVEVVRSFLALLGDDDAGIFVSTGGFTRDAEIEVRGQEKRRVMLVDLKRLFDLWVEHYGKIPEEERNLLPLKTIHFLAPSE